MSRNYIYCSVLYTYVFIFSAVSLWASPLGAEVLQAHEKGALHEAFVTRVIANPILRPADLRPPTPINEKPPRQLDMQAEWIPGYWSWNEGQQDFIWTSGVWRRPPPGHQWISGFWKRYDEGWVWVRGFWSPVAEQHLDFIGKAPPDLVDENTAPPPTSNYFWVPGYWVYNFDTGNYQWVKGSWEEFDSQWVLIPAHYVWRPGGFVFVPAYWDWTLQDRGTAYAPLIISLENRTSAPIEPALIIRPQVIVQNLYLQYPDYLSFFQHYTHFHPEFLHGAISTPSWWQWDTWWSLSWNDQWALWWWYTHPGYPQPPWMTEEISGILPPPLSALVVMMRDVEVPVFVTPDGVVTPQELFTGIHRTTGSFLPIVPRDERSIRKIYRLANANRDVLRQRLRPIGRRLPINPSAIRPNIRKPLVERELVMNIPRLSQDRAPRLPFKPKIPSHHGRSSVWDDHNRGPTPAVPTYSPPIRRPSWSPRSQELPKEQNTSANAIPGNASYEDARQFKRWHQMKPYSVPAVSRPPIHKSKDS